MVAVVHGSLVLSHVLNEGPAHLDMAWFEAADLRLRIGFDLSITNLSALELVTFMSLLSQVFALGYLDKDWSLARFFALVGFFEGAMAGVVLSSNLFMSYFLLEMLTLSTYLLVGFWYAQPLVVTAARDAFLTKRVGDVLLLMAMVALSAWAGSMEFTDLYEWAGQGNFAGLASTLLCLGLIAGPMGKCAQFPMHLWLDEAMEGPNPASILRNSAVVTCGAVVLLKVMPLLRYSSLAINVLLVVGTISALGGALVAIAQVDLKRAFSYSTTSAMGLVFIAIAMQEPAFAFLLLLAHGLAKALLFMGVGGVIGTCNCQDLTELGGLGSRMPATSIAYLVGAAGLTGLLPLGCFWCFGLLVEVLGHQAPLLASVVLVTNFLTTLNLTRVYRAVFLGDIHPKTLRAPEVNWLMALPMLSLAVMVGLTPLAMARFTSFSSITDFSFGTTTLLVFSSAGGILAGGQIRLDRLWSRSSLLPLRIFQDLLAADFYTERIYRLTIVNLISWLARLTDSFDRLVVNGLVDRIGLGSMAGAETLRYGVSGQLQSYVFTVLVAIILLFTTLFWVFL